MMAGPNSTVDELGSPSSIERLCASAEAVSFDVFDTLFYRLLPEPENVFDLVGEQFGVFDFRSARIAAQVQAFVEMNARGDKEITLDGIYACLADVGVPAETLKQAEWQTELKALRPNPEIAAILDRCRTRGQTCVVTSDMYLPEPFFEELFTRNDIAVDRLFISADVQLTKRDDGSLFRHVSEQLGLAPERICHVGDNAFSDIQRGGEQGFATAWYRPGLTPPSANDLGIQALAVSGAARSHIYHRDRSPWWHYGFAYGGPIVYGFLNWLAEKVTTDRLDKLLFLSRDGYTLHNIWTGDGRSATYFRCSRVALTLSAINENNFDDYLSFLLSGAEGLSVGDIFARIGVDAPEDGFLKEFGLDLSTRFTADVRPDVRSVLIKWRWHILRHCRRCRRALHAYCLSVGVRDGERIGVVDVGWSGSTQDAFVQSVGELFDLEIKGYYLCLREDARSQRPNLAMTSMLGDALPPDAIERVFEQRVLFEMFFSAPHDSVVGYDLGDDGEIRFIEDTGRGADPRATDIAAELGRGIEAFVGEAGPFFQTLPTQPGVSALAMPLVHLATSPTPEDAEVLGDTWNFDAWGSSAHFRSYLAAVTEDEPQARGDAWPAGLKVLREKRNA